uniref:Uncharacterized protein n=1 Tax=Arion vulgaris TaxID=1028688 RepID=A0A0B7AUK4_9EUPU
MFSHMFSAQFDCNCRAKTKSSERSTMGFPDACTILARHILCIFQGSWMQSSAYP